MSEHSDNGQSQLSFAVTPPSPEETALKLRLLKAQVAEAENKMEKARRDEGRAQEEERLKLEQLRAQTDKAQLELVNLQREYEIKRAAAQDALEYTFAEMVTDASVKAAIAELGNLSRRFPRQPITFILTSPGGSVLYGFALYDYLRALSRKGHKITVQVFGMAASMGGILLQAGDVRQIGEQSEILIHEVASFTVGKVNDQQEGLDFAQHLWDKLAGILARRARASGKKKTMTAAQIKKKSYKFDWWLDAGQAVRLGFADEII